MAFRSRIFEKFLFDTNLYFNKCSWHDETELLYRLKNKGIKIRYNHKAIVRHFKMPAEYRKNFETGAPMNRVYMYSKKISLPAYYQILFSSLKSNNVTREQDYLTEPMKAATGLLFSKNKNPLRFLWLLYVLFFSIPIKAKIQDAKEEKKFAHYLLQR